MDEAEYAHLPGTKSLPTIPAPKAGKPSRHVTVSPLTPLTVGSSKLTMSAVRSSPSRVSYPLCHKPGRSRIRLSAHRPQPLGPTAPPSVLRSSGCCAGHRPTPRSAFREHKDQHAKTSGRSGRDPVVVPAASRWVRPYCAAAAMADAIRGQRLLDFPVDLFLGLRGGASLR